MKNLLDFIKIFVLALFVIIPEKVSAFDYNSVSEILARKFRFMTKL